MVFDAAALWWPPFHKLYTQLETLKLEPSAVPAEALKATLAEYEPWLARGTERGFRPPSEASRKALESETSLSIGTKKLPVEAGLRAAAADISRTLQLDEVQAYILLRRWVAKAGSSASSAALSDSSKGGALGTGAGAAFGTAPTSSSGGGGGGGAIVQAGATLSPAQRLEVAQLYYSERLCLLKSIEDLLWEGERAEGGPLLEVIEGALSHLLEQSLEDTTFQALQANLDPPAGTSASSALASSAPASSAPITFGAFSGGGGGGGSGAASMAAAVSESRAAAAANERCSLLNILILIYYHPRKQCTPDRFLSLARLFHGTLFTRALPRTPSGALASPAEGEPSPAQMSIKLATLLLLEMLDVDKALAALASQQPLDEASYVFAAPAVKQKVNAELASWWPAASAAHSPVLLAWAAVLCLIGKSADGSDDSRRHPSEEDEYEFEVHASKAHETDALGTLCMLTTHTGLQPNAAEMFNNIVLSTMSAAFAAFNFSPSALPLPQLDAVVRVMANLFRDQPALCEGFWAGDRVTDEPLRHFLDDLRGLYPALPTPLYTMLAALSSTADAAASANAYLAQLSSLACLHVLPDTSIEQDCNEDGDVYAQHAVPLPGARALTLPQGVLGEVMPLPEGLSSTDSLWTLPPGEDLEHVELVRWRLAMPDGAGQWILLCRMSEALALVQQSPPGLAAAGTAGAAHTAAALAELSAALQLLSAFCTRDPQTALELLHLELPTGALEGGQRGPDLLSMACQAVAVLAQLPEPPAATIGDCLSICAALAEGIPGRVLLELLSLCGIPPAVAAGAAPLAHGQAPEVPLLSRILAAESAVGRYPALQAFLQLLTTLVSAASPAPALQVLVAWVLYRFLAEHRHWRYAQRAERWRLARLGLRLVRLSLLSAPAPGPAAAAQEGVQRSTYEGEGGSAIAAAVAGVLRYDVGMTACLLSALPHHAEQLERTFLESRLEGEVMAVEDCCVEWHRLLPVLLPPGSPEASLAPAAFFRPCPSAGGGDAACASAAAVLLSYISYPYFGSSERALVMRSMHCLAAAAAAAAPGAVFAVLLPQESPEAGVASAARNAIAAAFSPEAAAATPQLLAAACDALVTSVQCHPSLLDALLFPCGLEQALMDKENQSSNAVAAPAGGDAAAKGAGSGGKASKASKAAPRSCLDALWELLQQRERLQKEQPAVLAKILQVLSAFWQSSGAAFRAIAVLQRQPELWGHITGLLESAAQAGPLSLPALHGGEADEASAAAVWAQQEPAAALVAAEAYALQILAAECYTWAAAGTAAGSAGAGSVPAGMPADVAALLRRLPAGLVPRLLERYALPLPTSGLLSCAQQAAAAAGLQLLGAALSDEALWRSMAEGASLAMQLSTAAQPLLQQFGSQAEAARVLADHAPQIAARNFRSQHAVVEVSRLVMQQAEVPQRVAADSESGASFVYDAQLLGKRLGSVLVQQLDQLQALPGWLKAASVAASLEDARLAAITALKVLLTAAHKQRLAAGSSGAGSGSGSGADASGGVTAAAVRAALGTLADSLGEVTAGGKAATNMVEAAAAEAAAVDPAAAHLSNAAEAAYILLLLAQQWGTSPAAAADEASATALCSGVLQANADWLEVLESAGVASLSSSPDAEPAAASITHSLLAAALVLLPAAPVVNEGVQLPSQQQQRLQEVATQLLPLLLAACHRQPPQLVLIVSLATALIDRLVQPAAWLPLLRAYLHFGNLLHSMLLSLHSAAQAAAQAAAQQHASSAAALPALPAPGARPMALPPLPAALAAPPVAAAPAAAGEAEGQAGAGISPLAAASVEEAALLLALQVAQSRAGAELLLEQGAVAHALALGKWLLTPDGGNLMGETPMGGSGTAGTAGATSAATSAPPAGTVVDYSNAYRQDGSPNPAHRLWCCVLSLMAVLLAALPGHAAVEEAALQLAVEAEPRLLLAAEPPAASPQQPLTLAMAQETKYSLFFLCGLARLSGQWRMMLPDSLPAFRRATAAFLDFASSPGADAISCPPVSAAERAAARADAAAAADHTGSAPASGTGTASGAAAAFELGKGWFGAAAASSALPGGRRLGASRAGGYAWQLGERLYSGAQYALAFQLALAPEVGEEEVAELGPEWVQPPTLLAMQESALDVAGDLPVDARSLPSVRRLARTFQALLGLSSQMQDGMGVQRSHKHKQAVGQAISRLEATAASRRG